MDAGIGRFFGPAGNLDRSRAYRVRKFSCDARRQLDEAPVNQLINRGAGMMTSSTDLYRDTLYEEVWEMPMIELGKKYGISRAAVKWACIDLRVPLPPLGYWGGRAAGRPPERQPLSQPIPGQAVSISLKAISEKFAARTAPKPPAPRVPKIAKHKDRRSLVERVFGVHEHHDDEPVATPPILPDGQVWHPALKTLKNQLQEKAAEAVKMKKADDWRRAHPGKPYSSGEGSTFGWAFFCSAGQILTGRDKAPTRLTLATYGRGLLLLNAVFHGAAANGFEARVDKGSTHICLAKDKAEVRLRLIEKLRKTNQRQMGSFGRESGNEHLLTPTGHLELTIEQQGLGASLIKDSPETPLEDQIAKIQEAIEFRYQRSCIAVEQWRIRDLEFKAAEAKRQEENRRREEERRRAEEERKRRELLAAEVENWRKAESLRLYLFELDRRIREGEAPAAGYEEWRRWAVSVVDDLDSPRIMKVLKG
jgi:hypothetical protein